MALSASAVGFADALWLCPDRALRLFFASVSLVDPVALSPLSLSVSADGFRHWWAFRSCGRASPHAFDSLAALGDLRWLHLYRLTPALVSLRQFAVCRWSSGQCFILLLRDVLRVFMAIISRIQGYLLVKIAHRFLLENSQNFVDPRGIAWVSHPCISYALSQDHDGKTIRLAAIVGFSLIPRARSD